MTVLSVGGYREFPKRRHDQLSYLYICLFAVCQM